MHPHNHWRFQSAAPALATAPVATEVRRQGDTRIFLSWPLRLGRHVEHLDVVVEELGRHALHGDVLVVQPLLHGLPFGGVRLSVARRAYGSGPALARCAAAPVTGLPDRGRTGSMFSSQRSSSGLSSHSGSLSSFWAASGMGTLPSSWYSLYAAAFFRAHSCRFFLICSRAARTANPPHAQPRLRRQCPLNRARLGQQPRGRTWRRW